MSMNGAQKCTMEGGLLRNAQWKREEFRGWMVGVEGLEITNGVKVIL